jgi:E3 ubiquitin-protein ligase HERC4
MEEQTEVKLALMRMDKVCITKIACSNKHSLATTNTGAIFSWGQNDHGQLGFTYHKVGETSVDHSLTPRRIDGQGKLFFIDVACGDNHSLALSSSREAYVWGSNKHG